MPRIQLPEIDTIVLGSGHSQIAGHIPTGLYLHQISDKQSDVKEEIGSYGLFDSSSPNYTTYYPDVKSEDLKPSEDDFINPVFRLLSNVIVHKSHNPIEFPENVLRKSMHLLKGQTINVDHETAVGNAIGSITEVAWGKAYTAEDGTQVPAGINGKLKIDGKSNPRLARGILMDPPSIHSNSVTVRFKWKQSHEFEGKYEFWDNLGRVHSDGTIVRRIVTEVIAYSETSLVSHGADPFAKLLNDKGQIINPGMASSFYSFKQDNRDVNESKYFHIDYKNYNSNTVTDEIRNSLIDLNSNPTTPNNNNNNDKQENNMKKEQLMKLMLIFGITDETKMTEETFMDVIESEVAKLRTQVKTDGDSTKEIKTLKDENEKLKQEALPLAENAANGILALASLREKTVAAYKLSKGDKADPDMIKMIEAAKFSTATTFLNQYEVDTDEKFDMACNDCQSTNVSRASSINDDDETQNTGNNKSTGKWVASTDEELAESVMSKLNDGHSNFLSPETK